MKLSYRVGAIPDLDQIKSLAIKSWGLYQHVLTAENWLKLSNNLHDDNTFIRLFELSSSFVCLAGNDKIVGMAFLVPSGNPTDIYEKDWCSIRFVTVDPEYAGKGIGKSLTNLCIEKAKQLNERTIALHTSEIMDKARHIYESLGFTILKEIDPRLGKRYWLYTLELKGLK